MKINYLTPFAEERIFSLDAYVNDLIQFQKNYSPKFKISKYIPKINKLYNLLKECDYVKYWASGRKMYMWKLRNKVIRNKHEEDIFGIPIGSS